MIDSVAKQLEAIAGELAEVISQGANKQLIHKGIQPRESTLSLYRYDHDAFMGQPPPLSSDRHRESRYEHAISLHLLVDQCEFHVQSERGPLSFNAGPDTIVVTIGTQLEVTTFYFVVHFEIHILLYGKSLCMFISKQKVVDTDFVTRALFSMSAKVCFAEIVELKKLNWSGIFLFLRQFCNWDTRNGSREADFSFAVWAIF